MFNARGENMLFCLFIIRKREKEREGESEREREREGGRRDREWGERE